MKKYNKKGTKKRDKHNEQLAKTQLKVLKNATSQLVANDAVALFLTISDNEPVDSIPSGLAQYSKATLLAFQNKTQQAIDTLHQICIHYKGQIFKMKTKLKILYLKNLVK